MAARAALTIMLGAENRLKKKKDFEKIFKQGRGFKRGHLYLKITKNGLEHSRFGFIVGKNFSKKAVERNKIKRKLRELIKENLNKIKTGTDCVLVVMPGAESNYDKLKETVAKLFKKAGLFT